MSQFELTYQINLTKEELWNCLFDKLNDWWPTDFYTHPKTKRFVIETKLSGKMYEDFEDGEGLIWGNVIGVDYPHSLQVRGMLSGEFGGPAISYEKFSLSEHGEGSSVLKYRAEYIGDTGEKTITSLKTGWKDILENYLVPYCQKTVK